MALALGVLASCQSVWTQPGHGPENQRYNAAEQGLTRDNVATLEPIWSADLHDANSAPIVSGGRVHLRSFGTDPAAPARELLGFDAATGERLWATSLPADSEEPRQFTPPATLSGGELHLGTGSSFTRYDPASGAALGRVATAAPVRSSIVTGSGVHALVTVDPSWETRETTPMLEVRDAETLALRWRGRLPAATAGIWPRPIVSVGSGRIFVLSSARLSSFPIDGCGAATCASSWSVLYPGSASYTPPVVLGDTVFVGSDQALAAYRADTGALVWRGELGGAPSFLAAANGVVYLTASRALQAYDADGCGQPVCAPTWQARIDGGAGPPSVAGGVVYVGTRGAINAFDAAGCGAGTCSEMASVPVAGTATAISVAGGRLHAITYDPDTVVTFAPATEP